MNRTFCVFLFLLIGCSETEVEPDFGRLGTDYFPLSVGQYAIYEVESIEYDILGTIDISNFQMKSEVVDSFMSQSDDLRYVIHRHTRANEEDPWEFQTAWTAYLNNNQAVVVEENTPFLKLTFPVERDKVWDGNTINSMETDDYRIDSLNVAYVTQLEDTIQNTLTVIQSDNQDFIIQQDRRVEIYGAGIGLIYKQSVLLNYCDETECIGLQEIESGHMLTQSITAHGKN